MEKTNLKELEHAIFSQLKSIGYFSIQIEDEHERSFNVIADGNLRKIYLKVLIKLSSDNHNLTSAEISTIKRKAHTIQKEPWAAIMSVNEQGQLIDGIQWKNLSKISA